MEVVSTRFFGRSSFRVLSAPARNRTGMPVKAAHFECAMSA